jgi:signal transduction histidine kinase
VPDSEKWTAPDATADGPASSGERSWFRRIAGVLPHQEIRRNISAEIIAALDDVAGAVAGAHGAHDVLATIADRAKQITQAEKAAVVLTDETAEGLDVETVVVRGEMARHPQDWWLERLDALRVEAFASGETVMERHGEDDAWLACAPLRVRNHPVGMLAVVNSADRPFTDRQVAMLAILSAFAALSVESARLAEQDRYALLASERDRIAHEMHDGVVQSLFSISLSMEVCKRQLLDDPEATLQRLDELQQQINASISELRRFIYDLRPMRLAELGLVGALEYWVREITLGRPVRGSVALEGQVQRLTPSEEVCLYQVAKEAVSNAVRHSGAARIEVRVRYEPALVRLEIEDDGCGFDVGSAAAADPEMMGLRSIRHRVEREGGHFEILSQPDEGTMVAVELPVRVGRS